MIARSALFIKLADVAAGAKGALAGAGDDDEPDIGSRSNVSSAAEISRTIVRFSALRARGRLRVMNPARPRRSIVSDSGDE